MFRLCCVQKRRKNLLDRHHYLVGLTLQRMTLRRSRHHETIWTLYNMHLEEDGASDCKKGQK
jgi:hypothetical protein